MSVFDDVARKDTSPLKRDEGLFAFYDRSARPEIAVYRDIVNGWVDDMPLEAGGEITSRMRQGDDSAFTGAFAEVLLWVAIRNQGCEIELHPNVPNSDNRPDMFVKMPYGAPVGYFEVTTINPSLGELAHNKPEGEVQEALSRADIPTDLRLICTSIGGEQATPCRRSSVQDVEQWARMHANEAKKEVDRYRCGTGPDETFQIGDQRFRIFLQAGFGPNPVEQNNAVKFNGFSPSSATGRLTDALGEKASRYGELEHPYVIVVFDATESFMFTEDGFVPVVQKAMEAWFGTGDSPKHQNVSAVLVFPSADIWQAVAQRGQPFLVYNPWANHHLSIDIPPLGRLNWNGRKYQYESGQVLAQLLALPCPWPPRN